MALAGQPNICAGLRNGVKDNHASEVAQNGSARHVQGDPVMSLRQRVLDQRKERGWSQADLAPR